MQVEKICGRTVYSENGAEPPSIVVAVGRQKRTAAPSSRHPRHPERSRQVTQTQNQYITAPYPAGVHPSARQVRNAAAGRTKIHKYNAICSGRCRYR